MGKQRTGRKKIEQRTGARIQKPSIKDTSDITNTTGTTDAIEKAGQEIRMISDELSKKTFERIEIQKVDHPFNTGDHNEKLNALMNGTDVKIHVPSPSVNTNEITIAGDKGVQSAIETIKQINTKMVNKSTAVFVEIPKQKHKNIIAQKGKGLPMLYKNTNRMGSEIIECPGWIHRFLIGKNGSNLRELIEDNRKVHVEFSDNNKIIVKGPTNMLPKVVDSLKKGIASYDSTELVVDTKFCKYIIGKNGYNINRVKNDTGVTINISESGKNSIIRIEGRKDGVQVAKSALKEKIYKLENNVEKEISIDHRHHRAIIGVKGERVRELQEAYDVQITFPSSVEAKTNLVKIRGLNNDVNKAFESLSKLEKELDEANYVSEISVVKRFHRLVIGKGGDNIRKIRKETGTKIDLPHEGEDSDIIKVIGNREKVLIACDMIKKIVNEMEIIVTKEIVLGSVKIRNIIVNHGNRFIQSIKEDCGRNVTLKLPAVKGDNTIVIKGPENDVDCAISQIQKMVTEYHNSIIYLRVKPEFHKHLIGEKRANVKRIQDLTSTRIIFPPETDSSNETIIIIGKKENVDKAKIELEAMIVDISNLIEEHVEINQKYHNWFVAKRGEFLQKLEDECGGVKIVFPDPGAGDNVILKGSKSNVALAKKRLLDQVKILMTDFLENGARVNLKAKPDCQSVSISVTNPKHNGNVGFVMGNGAPWKKAHLDTHSDRDLPSFASIATVASNDGSDKTTSPPSLGNGSQMPMLYKKTNSMASETIECPVWMHRFLIGKNGSNLRELIEDNRKVHVEFLDSNKITVKGPTNMLPKIIDSLKKGIACYDSTEIVVDPKFCKYIIGKNGYNINRVKNDTGVTINISESEKNSIIRIEGRKNGVQVAKSALKEKIYKLENNVEKEISIDHRHHRAIIGVKGEKVRELQEAYNVQITFPSSVETKSNLVKIRGLNNDVNKAFESLSKLEKELDEANYVSEISVVKRFHRLVIGKGGTNIRKIRKETDTRIDLPHEDEDSDIIKVIGNKEKVRIACDMIKKIVNEMEIIVRKETELGNVKVRNIVNHGNRFIQSIKEDCGRNVTLKLPAVKGDNLTDLLENEARVKLKTKPDSQSVTIGVTNPKHKKNVGFVMVNGAPWEKAHPDTNNDRELPSFAVIATVASNDKTTSPPSLGNGSRLSMLYKKTNRMASETIECPGWMHRFLIGKNGSNLRELIEDNRKVHVEFLDNNKITVKGPTNMLPKVIESLKNEIACYDSTELVVDPKFCKHLIGKNGSNINRVKNDTGVTINISESEKNSIIRIEGRKDGVQLAKSALKETIYKLENKVEKEISIAQRHHRAIIGVKGKKVRELQEAYNVKITFPSSVEVKSNLVKIRGLNNDVNKAFESLAKLEKELDEANYVSEISVVI